MTNKQEIARELHEHHPGIPDENTSLEIVTSFFDVIRKKLLRENELKIDGIGTIKIATIAGSDDKKDARYKIRYKTFDRKVIKFKPSVPLANLINIGRTPSIKLTDEKNKEENENTD